MKKGKRIIVGNWKMNPETLERAKKIFEPIKRKVAHLKNVQTIIAPPFPFIQPLKASYSGKRVLFAAQDLSSEPRGAHTGETAASMLDSIGVQWVIIGHSERRIRGDGNEVVALKVRAALDSRLSIILCVGEKERDHGGKYLEFIREQVATALKGVDGKELRRIMIAYEPVYAIGKSANDAPAPRVIHETVLFIRRIVSELFDRDSAFKMPLLYGGAVETLNAGPILSEGEVQGFLVGHASLEPDTFAEILAIADRS